MSVPDRIRLGVKASGLSQAKIAKASGLAPQHFSAFLTGKYQANKHLPDIAKALGVSVEWLTTGDPTQAPTWAKTPPPTPALPNPEPLGPMPEALAARIAQVLGMTPLEVRAWGSTRSGLDSMTATLNALALHDDLAKERAARERAEAALAAAQRAAIADAEMQEPEIASGGNPNDLLFTPDLPMAVRAKRGRLFDPAPDDAPAAAPLKKPAHAEPDPQVPSRSK